jgi:hypothetical protein
MADSVFCNNCGEPIKEEPPVAGDPAQCAPCPKCGSTSRRIKMPEATGIITMLASSGTPTLTLSGLEDALLTRAQELIATGDFMIAVVVAHIACEISAERAILRAFAERGIEYRDEQYPNFHLANCRPCSFYNALTGGQIHKQPFWPGFKKSAARRNAAVHKGKFVTKAEAETSYKAASALVAYLK